jgi:hypothetical protein
MQLRPSLMSAWSIHQLSKQSPHGIVLHNYMQIRWSDRYVGITNGVANFGLCQDFPSWDGFLRITII